MKTFLCKNCGKENTWKRSTTNTYCNNTCQQQFQRQAVITRGINGENIKAERSTLRSYLQDQNGYRCSICNITDWNTKPITLQVDHIDGDASNNTFINLRLLCPNCHSQQDTWGAKNKGNGRKSRGLPLR